MDCSERVRLALSRGHVHHLRTVIEVRALRFRYSSGDFELSVPSLDVARGRSLALVGPSGSGKTTLLHLVAGIILPRVGSVVVGEFDVARATDLERRRFRIRRIGMVFQEFELLDHLDILQNVLLPYHASRALNLDHAARRRAQELIEQAGLAGRLHHTPRQLSQGERQRVAVCRALVTGPDLLLADEPTGNLDPRNKDRILDMLQDYASETGATLVTVTHDTGIVARFDEVIDVGAWLAAETEAGA